MRRVAAAAGNLSGDVITFGRELGILGLLLAAFGLVVSLTRRRTAASYPLLIAFAANLIGATVVVNFGASHSGLTDDLVNEGFVLGCYFVLACWLAIGAGELVAIAGHVRLGGRGRLLAPVAGAVLAAAVVLPLALGNRSLVQRNSKPFADRYASSAFSELPPHAAVFILGAELTQPLIYRQVVYHQRRDVAVIAADGLSYGWYREQLSRRLGITLPRANRQPDPGHLQRDRRRLPRPARIPRPPGCRGAEEPDWIQARGDPLAARTRSWGRDGQRARPACPIGPDGHAASRHPLSQLAGVAERLRRAGGIRIRVAGGRPRLLRAPRLRRYAARACQRVDRRARRRRRRRATWPC